jgi:hypothetical protein
MAVEKTIVRSLARRVAGRNAPNLAGAIFGTIVATAVVAGMDENGSVSPPRALSILLGTGAIFWAAHVYANLLADRIERPGRSKREDLRRLMSREWPLLQSSFPLALPLVLSWVGLLSAETAIDLATLVGVIALVGWGISFARREGYGPAGIVVTASVNAAFGLLMIGIKTAVA